MSATYWLDLAERAIKTLAQTLVATLSVGATGLLDVDWQQAASIAGLSAVLSILTSIASGGIGRTRSASVVPNVTYIDGRNRIEPTGPTTEGPRPDPYAG